MGQKSVLSHLLKSGEYSDLKFCCKGEEFKVHKVVVSEQSPVIKAAIQGEYEESQKNAVIMDNFHPITVRYLIQFIYTGDYELDNGAETLTVSDLVEEVVGLLKSQLDTKTSEEDSSSESPVGPPEGCTLDPSTESSPVFSLQKSASRDLFEHLRVNAIADYYMIDELVSLANKKTAELLQDDDRSWVTSLPAASEEALESTGNEEVFNILASAIATNISTVLELDQFRAMSAVSDFSIRILEACAEKIQSLVEKNGVGEQELRNEIDLHKDKAEQYKLRFENLERCSEVLMNTKRCRNCKSDFPCYIDSYKGAVRCENCKCKH